jgi:HK97 family phage portal protein
MESVADREQRIARLAESRALRGAGVESRALSAETVPDVFFPTTSAGPVITPRNALTVPAAWACVRALVDACSSLPMHVYRRGDAGRTRADGTLAAKLLNAPAPAVTQPAFLGHLMTCLQLHGEAFVGKFRDAEGRVAQLGMFDPSLVEVDVVGGTPFYTVTTGEPESRTVVLTTADVLHVRGALTLDGVRGASPVKVAREALGYAAALGEHGSRTFSNGAAPRGVLYVEDAGPQAEEMLANLAEGFEARHRGASNAGRIAYLTGAVKFQPVQMTNADTQWLEACRFSDGQVAQIFRVPPWVIGAPTGDSLTYATVAEQLRAFVMFSLRPWLVAIEAALGADAELFPGGLYPLFELDALLRADPQTRATVYTAALDPVTGWMSRAEVRELEDLPAEEAMTVAVAA